jgi:hypothetical protein
VDQRAAYTWDRACGVRFPLGRVDPPELGDKMLSAMVTADAEIRSGGFSQLFVAFDQRLDVAAEAYRYFGVIDVADALTAMAAARRRHGSFPDAIDVVGGRNMVSRAFRHLGVPGTGNQEVSELLDIATRHYLNRISPQLAEVFAAHFAESRQDYALPGHPSTWS